MWKRILSLLLILTLCLTLLPVAALAEPREEETPAVEDIQTALSEPEGESSVEPEPLQEAPNATAELQAAPSNGTTYTRGEWMHELVALFGLTLTKDEYPDVYFPDIVGTTYFDDIMVATKFGLVSVEAGDDFRPEDPLTREFAAQTVNYYLGILNDKDSYIYSDTADVTFRDDAQVALDQGWFTLVGGKFMPEQSVTITESDKILADAAAFLARRNNTETKADFEFADWVKILPDTVDVQSEFDRDTNVQTLTIVGYDGTLAVGDSFVYYYQDFACLYAVDTVTEKDGVFTVTTKEAPEGAALKYEYSGVIRPELDAFIPAEEPVTLMTADGGTVTFGEVELMASKPFEKDFSRKITLSNGVEGTLTAKIKNVTITPTVEWTRAGFLLEGDFELSSSIKFDFLDDPAAAELRLGGFDLGPFGYAGVVINLKAQATIGYLYKAHFAIGADYESGRGGSTTNNWNASDDCYCFADGELSARLALTAYVSFDKSSADVRLEAGPTMKFGYKVYNSGTPKRCLNTAGYLYAGVSADVTLKAPTGTTLFDKHWSKDFYNASNSPVRFGRHVEDGREVASCTRENDAGEVHGNYGTNKYATPSNSRYYANASANGSSTGYGGYGSEPVVIWTTKDNDDGTVTITGYQGNAAIVNIPEIIDGKMVTVIGEKAFQNNKTIQMVMMPDAVKSIGDSAFRGCSNLISITFGEGLTVISSWAFFDCSSLTAVHLPKSLKSLGGQSFGNCTSISAVYIPTSLETCSTTYAFGVNTGGPFYNCNNLDIVSWGEDITTIPSYLFYGCTGLRNIIIPDSVTFIDTAAFRECINLKNVTFSENLLAINPWGFYGCSSLLAVNLPDVTEFLGGQAFGNCTSISAVYIPASLEKCTTTYAFGVNTGGPFYNCNNLDIVSWGEDIATIPSNLFYGCTGLRNIIIPESVTFIDTAAFRECTNLENVTFSENLLAINPWGFYSCSSLLAANLPDVTEFLGGHAFGYCTSLKKIHLPNALTQCTTTYAFGVDTGGPFYNCRSLATVEFGSNMTVIPANCFLGCTGAFSANIPSSVTNIQKSAFDGCVNMTSLVIPDSVTDIGQYAFRGCGIKSVCVPESVQYWGYNMFQNCTKLSSVELPDIPWILEYMFAGCTSLTDTSWIPLTVKTIGKSAFEGCSGLTSVTLPDVVSTIDANAFKGCTSLTSFRAPNDLLTIGNNAFQDCTKLTDVDLNDGLETIGSYAFQNCSAQEKIVLPDTVYSIGSYCFQIDIALVDVTLSTDLTTIPAYAFANCTKLESLVIPKGVETIGNNAFYQDTKLKTFTIPVSVTSIGDNAFSYATTTTVNGVAGSYAETYAKWKAFNDVTKHADSITLASGKDNMTINYRVGFTPTFVLDPVDSTDLVTLTSDDTSVVSISNGSALYGQKKGTANITATTSGGKSITFPVTVDTATGIEVGHLPDKTEYNVGERKDRAGLIINQVFSNGDKEQVFGYDLSGFDTKTVGEKTITVTRGDFKTTFSITVDKLATGKMGNQDELTWTYSGKSGQVTITGPVSASEPVLVASYDENGKMLSVDFITKSGATGKADSQANTVKLFWLSNSGNPLCPSVTI